MGQENSATSCEYSVIVPVYDGGTTIDRCLDALARQTLPPQRYEVVVVDDGSTDNTRDRAKSHRGVRLLAQVHSGPAAARNLGVEHACGEIVLFTDADCEPLPSWMERLVAPFADPQVVGAKGVYLTRQSELVARFVQAEYEEKYDRMAAQERIDFVDTYAAAYRRDVFVANGGFDVAFSKASVEDQELSFRLARQGLKMVFVPEAVVYHWGHARDLAAYIQKKLRIGYWKVTVHRRHPDKLWRDSHTPQTLRVQIVLVGLGVLGLLGGLVWHPAFWAAVVAGVLFLLTTLRFAARVWRDDRPVAIASPGLLFVRAAALGLGFACGLLRPSASVAGSGDSMRMPDPFG